MTETPTLDASLAELVGKAAEALEKATATYGPDAVDLALEVGRIAAIRTVGTGLFLLVLASIGAVLLMRFWPWAIKKVEADDSYNDGGWVAAAVIATGLNIFILGVALSILSKIHAWVGMFRPEIYLAYEAIF